MVKCVAIFIVYDKSAFSLKCYFSVYKKLEYINESKKQGNVYRALSLEDCIAKGLSYLMPRIKFTNY